jgi:hypothetical protein
MLKEITVASDRQRSRGSADGLVQREFPTLAVRYEPVRDDLPLIVRAVEWVRPDFDFWAFDRIVDATVDRGEQLAILDDADDTFFPIHVLNRCQRRIERRNTASSGGRFGTVLAIHREMHDLSKPLVRADFDHALDVWQWVLRLDPEAGLAVQIAALFHDIERLESEPDRRVEHLATDYETFKNDHARAGGRIATDALAAAGLDEDVRRRTAALIARHESSGDDPEVGLLNDADALSFFSFNSPGYARYFSASQTQKKFAYTLARMSAAAREKMKEIYLRADLLQLLTAAGPTGRGRSAAVR